MPMLKIKYVKKRRKGKVGISFRRSGRLFYKDDWKKQETMVAQCLFWNDFKYGDFVLHTRTKLTSKIPICVIGKAKFPPLPFDICRYYLEYDPNDFIGEYEMRLYGSNAHLIFYLYYQEDFNKLKHIMNRITYLGSLCKIILVCSSEAVLPESVIQKEKITDYDIVFLKDTNQFIPYHKDRKSLEYRIPKNI